LAPIRAFCVACKPWRRSQRPLCAKIFCSANKPAGASKKGADVRQNDEGGLFAPRDCRNFGSDKIRNSSALLRLFLKVV